MKKKTYNILFVLGAGALLFYGASNQPAIQEENVKIVLERDGEKSGVELEPDTSETEILGNELSEPGDTKSESEETDEAENKLSEKDAAEIEKYYGTFRITQYLPLGESNDRIFSNVRQQEADLMLGRIIDLEQECCIIYGLGQREYVNYLLKRFEEQNPKYKWDDSPAYLSESLKAYGEDYVRGIKGMITVSLETPTKWGWGETFRFYTFQHTDNIIMRYDNRAFLMERCEEEPEEPLPQWNDKESRELLEKIYGEYQVKEFLPTKFFPS